jgi:hypothetical protein
MATPTTTAPIVASAVDSSTPSAILSAATAFIQDQVVQLSNNAGPAEPPLQSLQPCESYLESIQEPTPVWLKNFSQHSRMNWQDFFSSRLVYYPGSGFDGEAVRLFASTKSAHCFLYADYSIQKQALLHKLNQQGGAFTGYQTIARVHLTDQEIASRYWVQHVYDKPLQRVNYHFAQEMQNSPFAFLEILERKPEFDDSFGAQRIAILFVGGDGVATYDALFCQADSKPLFALVLQDHGFGGNYTRFGKGGLLHEIAAQCQKQPQYLWIDPSNTQPWDGYHQIENLSFSTGGMHNNKRYLFERKAVF